ncbi:FAS1-like dehydratase domain-containing protein [Rossellomorea aquimaris]|uniref:FAS1-like dehydratase domain-containing protein n=1 Tax=Rossellomorea aquimaris TaxID=189382 RepID=UPI0007D09114|nr:MaoC family dehydratase N-terminal domain-containing protein [Rossellomorea aquimaris]
MFEEGLKTEKVEVIISKHEAIQFAEALRLDSPLFYDEECAKSFSHPTVLLAPTYPVLFWKKVHIPWLKQINPLIHAEQHFQYEKPLYIDTSYSVSIQLNRVIRKTTMTFLEHELSIFDQVKKIARSTTVIATKEG